MSSARSIGEAEAELLTTNGQQIYPIAIISGKSGNSATSSGNGCYSAASSGKCCYSATLRKCINNTSLAVIKAGGARSARPSHTILFDQLIESTNGAGHCTFDIYITPFVSWKYTVLHTLLCIV